MSLSSGKYRGLIKLADDHGRFKMVAVDQRPPLFRALARHGERRPDEVRDDEISAVKTRLVRVLAPEASAILIDPVWTHGHALHEVPGRVGLLSTLEGYDFVEIDGERRSATIEDWSVAKIKRSGGDAVKLLAWHRTDVSEATQRHQDALIASVGDACREADLPFVLELLIYPLPGEDATSAEYAAAKPARVLASLARYADARYGVDLMKLEFPTELKHTREFASGAFDGVAREPVHDLADVRGFLQAMDETSPVPWVLLSAGVGPREFAVNLELAVEAGASGFLAGRAVWMDALDPYPDLDAVETRLRQASLPYLRQISGRVDAARSWTAHRRFGGAPALTEGGRGWHRRYRG